MLFVDEREVLAREAFANLDYEDEQLEKKRLLRERLLKVAGEVDQMKELLHKGKGEQK